MSITVLTDTVRSRMVATAVGDLSLAELKDFISTVRASARTSTDRQDPFVRGRAIGLWFADPGFLGWRYVSGEATVLGASGGGASEPFRARWDRLAPVGRSWTVRFLVDLAGGATRELAVRVTVRAPGLVE